MNKQVPYRIIASCLIISLMPILSYARSDLPAPNHLVCEYLENPLGVHETAPRLSWRLDLPLKRQTAYRILVSSDRDLLDRNEADVWDTGKVDTDQSTHVVYAGRLLESGKYYFWKVRVWTSEGGPTDYSEPAYWQMGLLRDSDWDAMWIGPQSKLGEDIPAHVGYHSKIENSPDHTKWVQIDLRQEETFDSVVLYPVQPFSYSKSPGFLFPTRFRIDVSNDPEFTSFETVADFSQENVPNPGDDPFLCEFPEQRTRYVRLTVTQLTHRDADNYGFALAEMEVKHEDEVISENRPVKVLDAVESRDWSIRHLNDGVKTTQRETYSKPGPASMLRSTFRLPSAVKQATLHATAKGLYEARINGERVGENILAPEWTDYKKRIQVQTYDVTNMLEKGENAIGALLGEGWYAGLVGTSGHGEYGSRLGLLLQLEVECVDGSVHRIATDNEWRVTEEGPIRSSDIIRGETYDARREMRGWDRPGFDDSDWQDVHVLPPTKAQLVAQPNEPIQITQELAPVQITEPTTGVYVFDMGQNMVGWCRLKLRGEKGRQIELRHGERLNPDGTVYTKNLRDHNRRDPVEEYQKNVYICSGEDEELFEPHFTYHGFRYVEVSGLSYRPVESDLTGCVFHSASPLCGEFESSNTMLNRLVENAVWSQRGNMHSTPTDCPQRDERLGWMGDAQIFSQAACFTMNMAGFFTKWCQDIRDAQVEDGRFSDFSPNPIKDRGEFLAAPAWADAGVIVPWRVYVNYGDQRILGKHFEAAEDWIHYVKSQSPDLIWIQGRGNDYGDWLNGNNLILDGWPREGADTPREVFATAFFAYSTELVAKMARVLGREDKARQYTDLADQIKSSFVKHFVESDGRIRGDTQTIYALALHFDLVPESMRSIMLKHLLREIEEYNGSLSTGIQGTNRMMLTLADENQLDLAYDLLTKRSVPSWGYMIDQGATTIWERWDGYVEGRGFQNPGMNSFNHYAFGAIGEWMYRNIVGINPDPSSPGYKHIVLKPRPGGDLKSAHGQLETLFGMIESSWRIQLGKLNYSCTVPSNTNATLYLPTSNPDSLNGSQEVEPVSENSDCVIFELEPGHYFFVVDL